ncbi:hypothetical protein HK096_007030, partial [Nowakowskiella sp. JEL0078]
LASENRHTDVVKLLLEDVRVDPFDHDNYAFLKLVQNGHAEILQLLITGTGELFNTHVTKLQKNKAFQTALQNKHVSVMSLLLTLPGIDPTVLDYKLFDILSESANMTILELSLKHK